MSNEPKPFTWPHSWPTPLYLLKPSRADRDIQVFDDVEVLGVAVRSRTGISIPEVLRLTVTDGEIELEMVEVVHIPARIEVRPV